MHVLASNILKIGESGGSKVQPHYKSTCTVLDILHLPSTLNLHVNVNLQHEFLPIATHPTPPPRVGCSFYDELSVVCLVSMQVVQ